MVVKKEDMEMCANLLLLKTGSMPNSKKAKDVFYCVRSAYPNNPPNPLKHYLSTC